MRRRHWWGVGASVVALVSAAVVGPTSLVANATTHKPSISKSSAHGKPNPAPPVVAQDHHGRPGHHDDPPYPPHRDCSVSLTMPDKAHKGQTVTVSVTVSYNKQAQGGATVGLYNSKDGENWKLIDTKTAGPDGHVDFSYIVNHDALVKVVVAAGDHKATQSPIVKITVKKKK
jgi:hypothetical protein